jgi:hypothetical protein
VNTLLLAGTRAARADWAPAIEAAARTIAALGVACFVLGEAVGRWVHETSAVLGQLHACLLVGHARTAAALEQIDAATDAFVEAVVERALPSYWDLIGLTVVELRTLARQQGIKTAGGRRVAQARRDDLLLVLGA